MNETKRKRPLYKSELLRKLNSLEKRITRTKQKQNELSSQLNALMLDHAHWHGKLAKIQENEKLQNKKARD